MNHLIRASIDEVSRLAAKSFYDFIIVGTGMGGGVLARTLVELSEKFEPSKETKASDRRPLRVLLIEQGGLVLSTHCANTSTPRWNTSGLEGPSMNTDIVFRSLKSSVSTNAKSIEYVGGPVHCIGGRSTVWGLYTPEIPKEMLSAFPKSVQDYLTEDGYNKAYKILCNNSATLGDPYPACLSSINSNIVSVTTALNQDLGKGNGFEARPFTCCPTAVEFIPQAAESALYRIPMGAFSTVDWILERVYNGSENVNLLAQTQVLTVNECTESQPSGNSHFKNKHSKNHLEKTVGSLTVRDHLGIEHSIPTGNATVILSAGTLCTARIALRSDIGGPRAGSGLTDHDIWGTRFEYMPSKDGLTAWLGKQALKLQSWVKLGGGHSDCLLNVTINAESFLGPLQEHFLPIQHFDKDGRPMSKYEFHKELSLFEPCRDNMKPPKVQVVFEFKSKLMDQNRVLNLPQPYETVHIESREDNTIYLSHMRDIARKIKVCLEKACLKNSASAYGEGWEPWLGDEDEDQFRLDIQRAGFGVVAHEVGTMRMGDDSEQSVVDEDLKVHGWSNLHVCDLSVFPESPAANPSLVLTALAQRLGTKLYDDMQKL